VRHTAAFIVAFVMGVALGRVDIPYLAANPEVKPPELLAPWSPALTLEQIELDLLWEELGIREWIEYSGYSVLPGNVEL
jgi:hypothetical protein